MKYDMTHLLFGRVVFQCLCEQLNQTEVISFFIIFNHLTIKKIKCHFVAWRRGLPPEFAYYVSLTLCHNLSGLLNL